jgi:glycine C-acetyltransferase/8-amino-7-oxononanoate synthase
VTNFKYRDPQNLAEMIRRDLKPGERPLVLSDGVFQITGEIAPLDQYVSVIKDYNGWLGVDDAHGVGVLGAHGRGTVEHLNLHYPNLIFSATLSKALGGHGGVLPGSNDLISEIKNNSRIYGAVTPTALPIAAASRVALNLARNPMLRKQLVDNVYQARNGLRKIGLLVEDTPVPIICLETRAGFDFGRIQEELFNRDIAVSYIKKYSNAPAGGAIRIAIFATHSSDQIDHLVSELAKLL